VKYESQLRPEERRKLRELDEEWSRLIAETKEVTKHRHRIVARACNRARQAERRISRETERQSVKMARERAST
jgi:hypothetical protein